MGLLIFFLLLALIVSFTCSILESVLLTTPISYLKMKATEGYKGVRHMIWAKEHLDNALSAILTLNTISHTVGAAGVGVQSAKIFGEEWAGWTSAILTTLILVFTEILPKSMGTRYWRQLANTAGAFIRGMVYFTYPLVWVSSLITAMFKGKEESTTSREEVSAVVQLATEEGVLEESESIVFRNIMNLKNIRAEDVMTPRTVLVAAPEELTLKQLSNKGGAYKRFSRIPLYTEGNLDNVTGYLFMQEVYESLADDKDDMKLSELRRNIVVVPESRPLINVWEELLQQKEHIALVTDE